MAESYYLLTCPRFARLSELHKPTTGPAPPQCLHAVEGLKATHATETQCSHSPRLVDCIHLGQEVKRKKNWFKRLYKWGRWERGCLESGKGGEHVNTVSSYYCPECELDRSVPVYLICSSASAGSLPTNPCKCCHFYQTSPFAEYGMVSLCSLPQKAPHAPSSLFTFRKCSLNCKQRHVQAIDLHRVEAFALHLLPAAYDVLPSFKASAKLHVALDENLGISTTVLVLPASTVRRSRKVDSAPCKTSMVQTEGSWNDAKDQEDISIRSTKNPILYDVCTTKENFHSLSNGHDIQVETALLDRSKMQQLRWLHGTKPSRSRCALGPLWCYEMLRCHLDFNKNTPSPKRNVAMSNQKGSHSDVVACCFLIEQLAKLFVMFLSSFDIFRTRYRIGLPPYGFELIWVTLHKASHSCAANQISACVFFLGMLVHFVLYSFQFISFRFVSYRLI